MKGAALRAGGVAGGRAVGLAGRVVAAPERVEVLGDPPEPRADRVLLGLGEAAHRLDVEPVRDPPDLLRDERPPRREVQARAAPVLAVRTTSRSFRAASAATSRLAAGASSCRRAASSPGVSAVTERRAATAQNCWAVSRRRRACGQIAWRMLRRATTTRRPRGSAEAAIPRRQAPNVHPVKQRRRAARALPGSV